MTYDEIDIAPVVEEAIKRKLREPYLMSEALSEGIGSAVFAWLEENRGEVLAAIAKANAKSEREGLL